MARPRKYATAEERATARKLQKLAWFHRNATKLNTKRRQSYREQRRAVKQQQPPDSLSGLRGLKLPVTTEIKCLQTNRPRRNEPISCGASAYPTSTNGAGRELARERLQKPAARASSVAKVSNSNECGRSQKLASKSATPCFKTSSPARNPPELKIRGLVCMPGSSKYWVTRSLSLLKEKIQKYKNNISNDTDTDLIAFLDCCAFWEDALSIILPVGDFLEGLRTWGAALFTELTRSIPDPEMDSRTTARRECNRLSREIDTLGQIAAGLREIAFDIDPFANDHLVSRAQKLERKVSLLSNVIGELALLHDSGLDVLVEAEHDRMLNYQVAVL